MNAIFPSPAVAAIAIMGIVTSQSLPQDLQSQLAETPEPYRWAATLLGWGAADGNDWWCEVMDTIG